MSQELSVPGDSARCLHLLTSGPVTDLSTPPRMENPQIPFSYEFPEGEGGRYARPGGEENPWPATILQREEAAGWGGTGHLPFQPGTPAMVGRIITPALGPGIRGCPPFTKSAGTAAGLLALSLPETCGITADPSTSRWRQERGRKREHTNLPVVPPVPESLSFSPEGWEANA